MAEERHFRDFRDDHVLGIRQFQVALRRLRRLSNREETPATELDVEETVAATTKKGGQLEIIMKKPRKNQTKLLLLMDSGGSMDAYVTLCARLFQALSRRPSFQGS